MLACYRTELVERHEGAIDGLGLFATQDISQDQLLAIKGGRLITEQTLLANLNVINGSHHQVTPSLYLAGLTPEEVDATLIGYNHSCDPNAYVDGNISLRSLRPIAEGEEVTVDYGTIFSGDTQTFECKCGSGSCRHVVQPSVDSVDPEIVARYGNKRADFLVNPGAYNADMVAVDPECPTTSFISSKLERIEAKIHGIGLVATSFIKQGELVGVRGGTIVNKDAVVNHQDQLQGSEVQITDEIFLAGFTPKEHLATLLGFNHSCDPNSFIRGQINIFAMRDVKPGEEMTVDYATVYMTPSQKFACRCGEPSCRGQVDTTTDWRIPELQARFEGYFANFIQRDIEAIQ